MSEKTAFYIRTAGPAFAPPRSLLESLRILLEVGEEGVQHIAASLDKANGYLSDESLESLIASVIGDDEANVARLTNLLMRGTSLLREGEPPTALLDYLEDPLAGPPGRKTNPLTADEKATLSGLLPKVIRRYPALERQAKALRLAEAFPLRAEAVNLICDLRPVFDDTRTQVEGVIPLTTLKVVASGVDRFPVSFEAVLSARDVLALQKEVENAVAKLNALGKFAERAQLPVPDVDLTETEE